MFSKTPCQVCLEKDKRIQELKDGYEAQIKDLKLSFQSQISDLKISGESHQVSLADQVQYLRTVLNPPTPKFNDAPMPIDRQQDMILDGGGQDEADPLLDVAESPEVLAERAAMLSGTY